MRERLWFWLSRPDWNRVEQLERQNAQLAQNIVALSKEIAQLRIALVAKPPAAAPPIQLKTWRQTREFMGEERIDAPA